jgi:predicted XRE-type DNA-binding protein
LFSLQIAAYSETPVSLQPPRALLCGELSETGILTADEIGGAQFDMAQVQAAADRTPNLRRTRTRRPSLVEVRRPRLPSAARRHLAVGQDKVSSPKHLLASQINRLLDQQQLGQLAAAERLGISQSKVSAIRNYKLHGISLGSLMEVLVALDQLVTIVVRSREAHHHKGRYRLFYERFELVSVVVLSYGRVYVAR